MGQSGLFLLDGVKQVRWTSGHHLSNKNHQPSTIDGYRSAIVDKLGNASLNVSKDENLTCLLDSFHRDRHLTFKTVFLLVLGSGKCRSEIHAWLNKNIRQADW